MNSQVFALLSDQGSLTDRFKQIIGTQPCLKRLSQGHQFVSKQERDLLDIMPRQMALVREITMGDGQNDWMFARTIVPLTTLKGAARRISYLNEAPIGKILFGRYGASRKSMQVSMLSELPKTLVNLGYLAEKPLWQRQSIFEFSSGPLIVTEIFLYDSPIYSATNESANNTYE